MRFFSWRTIGICLAFFLSGSISITLVDGGNPFNLARAESIDDAGDLDLTTLSLEELMEIQVTSLGKKQQKLVQTTAAVYVITHEDIRRSGVTSIPEALRMAPGVQVGRINNNQWAVSIRGFNDRFANKLLVLLDGRPVYNSLFTGVTWEIQDTMLEDIERIEISRGPAGTLWGVNAMNGVINIITKHSRDTQGALLSGLAGSEEDILAMRYGGHSDHTLQYRLFGKYWSRDTQFNQSGAHDDTRMFRGGFRADWAPLGQNAFMFEGELYQGKAGQQNLVATSPNFPYAFTPVQEDIDLKGGHFLGNWKRDLGYHSNMVFQLFYDHFEREERAVKTTIDAFNADFQHQFPFLSSHDIIWGLEYRLWNDDFQNTISASTYPASKTLHLVSGFLQDEVYLIPNTFSINVGTKISHNPFTGFEYQPSGRILFTPSHVHSFWGAVSRAVRIPSRFEQNSQILIPPSANVAFPAVVRGQKGFKSETLLSYELGYRFSDGGVFFDLTGFYNFYHHLRGGQVVSFFPPTSEITNNLQAQTWGVEVAADLPLQDWWKLRLAYSYIDIDVDGPAGNAKDQTMGLTPKHQGSIRSLMNFPGQVEFDSWVRIVDNLTAQPIGAYVALDLRLGWKPMPGLELSLVGKNLFDNHHPEFQSSFLQTQSTEIQRSVYGKITWGF
ncbi:MAG: TonB-dependent receptor [Nitrospirales bacterium]|nr:TonB-dependent receptor [Nitrospira sp.]MDR4502974.1 TonB-dependent receptor [Nitrospirales bacterium]